MEELFGRFEEKIDRLANVMEKGLSVVASQQHQLLTVMESGFAMFNGRAIRKFGQMTTAVESLVGTISKNSGTTSPKEPGPHRSDSMADD